MEESNKLLASKMINLRSLICIEYPGVVKNEEKMLSSLGGINAITKAHYSKGLDRLELRFRSNAFCKPTCGEQTHVNGLVIKITKKKHSNTIVRMELIGSVRTCYLFKGPCEFQYLPMRVTPDGCYQSFYNEIVPDRIVGVEWLNKDCPLYLPPPTFSRYDTPTKYCYRREPGGDVSSDSNIIKLNRCRTNINSQMVAFDTPAVPVGPVDACKNLRQGDKEFLAVLQKKFQERPIWTKLSLTKELQITDLSMYKIILNQVAYYFTNGPWMKSWVRYGYDPRKDPESRRYQVLDFRMNKRVAKALDVDMKRNYSNASLYKSTKTKNQTSTFATGLMNQVDEDSEVSQTDIPTYVFKVGEIPRYRTSAMQYCDIEIPEMEDILKSEYNNECDVETGWFKKGVEGKLRTIMHKYIQEEAQKRLKERYHSKNDDRHTTEGAE